MSLWSRIRGALSGETKAVDISADLWSAINGGWGLPTKSGEQVSSHSALHQPAFYRGVVLIAEGVAQVPGEIYRPVAEGRGDEPFKEHPLYFVLRHRASDVQDAFQFWRTIIMYAAATGNGYAYKNVVNGVVRELIPIRPECVQVELDRLYGRKYTVTFENGDFAVLDESAILHLKGPSWHLHRGLDPSSIGRESIGLAQATEKTHAALHRNGVRPSGTINVPKESKLTEDDVARLKAHWAQSYAGSDNAGSTPLLTHGMEWKPLRQSGVESEHLDTRKHQIAEIARLLGLFPIMLGHSGDQNPTFASSSEFFGAHVRYSLQPWGRAVKSAVESQLLSRDEVMAGIEYRVDFSELMRGSLEDRTAYYKAALGTNSTPGWLSPNEIRQDDGWNPSPDPKMDEVWQPSTMAPVSEPPAGSAGSVDGQKSIRPRSLYVMRPLVNGAEFLAWAKKQGFGETLKASDLHVTIAYSRRALDWMAAGDDFGSSAELIVSAGGPRVVEAIGQEGAVALLFASSRLMWRHQEIIAAGASWDHPDYQPHITITYQAAGVDLDKVQPFRGELRFGPEQFSEIDPNWKDERLRK